MTDSPRGQAKLGRKSSLLDWVAERVKGVNAAPEVRNSHGWRGFCIGAALRAFLHRDCVVRTCSRAGGQKLQQPPWLALGHRQA